ncbi:MAG: GNAT family N-acetyltransferase, partial [Bacteroidota bacterium]
KERYRQFCKEQTDLPIFVQDWYLDAVCVDGEWSVALVIEKDKVVASLPYFVKKRFGFTYIAMPPFVKMMGPYLIPELRNLKDSHKYYQALIDQLPKIDGFKQNFHPQVTNWLPFYWQGFQQTTRYTYLIKLEDKEQLWNQLNRNMRRNIKKAEAQLRIVEDLPLSTFYELNQKSFDRQSVKIPYAFDLLEKHDAALLDNKSRKLFFALDQNDQIHSAAHLIWDKESAYYHLSGDDPALRNSGAGILMVWKAICYSLEQLNVSYFDFEGSVIENVEKIRRQFGAEQVPYFEIWRYDSRWYKWVDQLIKVVK